MVEKNLDFRSDTVTWPTPEMREASYKAKLGDDVYRDDPTVNELEAIGAEIFGKEAGLFVTSGTQGNAVSVLAHTQRGDEIILEERSHIYVNEVGGLAVMGQLMAAPSKARRAGCAPTTSGLPSEPTTSTTPGRASSAWRTPTTLLAA